MNYKKQVDNFIKYSELKELVKQHFSLVEIDVEKFDKAMLEDGSEVSNQKSGKFAIGDVLFIKDKEGKFVPVQ